MAPQHLLLRCAHGRSWVSPAPPTDSNSALAAPLTWDLLWTVFHIDPVCSSAMNLFSVTVGTIR